MDRDTGLTATSDATIRDPFPGNASRRSGSIGWQRISFRCSRNQPSPALIKNFRSQAANVARTNQWGTKIDHAFSDNHKIYGSFVWSQLNTPGASPVPGALGVAIPSTEAIRIFRLSEDSILRPNLINHAHLWVQSMALWNESNS